MKHLLRPVLAILALLAPTSLAVAQNTIELRILAINDFHGYLYPSPGGIRIADPADRTNKIAVAAGGSETMASVVRNLRDGHPNTIFVAAGDLIGASPFLSAMFHDEPTIESLSMMGLEIASVGNHEFDEGKDELLRMQNGGCHPADKCQGPHPFLGAKFHYLAASTVEKSTGKTLFPSYEIRTFDGIPIAFIGLTLRGTPEIISPAAAAGLEFRDEAASLQRHAGVALHTKAFMHTDWRVLEGGPGVAQIEVPTGGDVAGLMNAALSTLLNLPRARHDRQRLPVDFDFLCRILGLSAALRHHDRDRLSEVARHVARDHRLQKGRHIAVARNAAGNFRGLIWKVISG